MQFLFLTFYVIIIMVIKLKELFLNKTTYTQELYSQFIKFHNKIYHFSYNSFTIIILGFLLLCLVLQFINHYYVLVCLLTIITISFLLWRIFHPISLVQKEFTSDKIKNNKIFTFKFYDKYFEILDDLQYSKLKYYDIHKVYETNNFFYIYIDKTHSLILKKENFLTRYIL